MIKKLLIFAVSLFILSAPLSVLAVQVSVPSAPGAGYGLVSTTTGNYIATSTHVVICAGSSSCGSGSYVFGNALTITGVIGSTTLLGDSNTWSGTINKFSNAPALAITGLIKGNGSSAITAGVNGTDFTLITAKTCTAGDFVSSVTAPGVFTCTTPSAAATASTTLLGDNNTFSGIDLFTNASSNFSGTWQTFSPAHFQVAGSYLTAAITGLKQTYGATQTGATQTLATSSDTNIGITITTGSDTHTFTPTWIGTLADARITSAATWNAKLSAVTADSPLSGSGTSASHLTLSTAGTWSGNAGTATALAGNGTNCTSQAATGVDASGNAEGCFTVSTFAYPFTTQTQFGNTTAATGTMLQLTGGFSASSTSWISNLKVGSTSPTTYTNAQLVVTGNVNSYTQNVLQNISNGANASACQVMSNDLSTDTTYFGELCINSSGYTTAAFNAQNAGDVSLNASDGALVISTASTTNTLAGIRFATGGTASSSIRAVITQPGLFGVGSTSPFAQFAIHAAYGKTNTTLFAIGSSSLAATTTLFSISNTGSITTQLGNALVLSGGANAALSAYGGAAACTNQVVTALSALGATTCTTVSDAMLASTFVKTLTVTTAQGVSGTFSAGATPALSLTFGAMTGVTSYNGLIVTANTGVVTTGTWNGTTIAVANGGTGATAPGADVFLYTNHAGNAFVGVASSSLNLPLTALTNIAANTILGNITGAAGAVTALATSSQLFTGSTGQSMYFNGTNSLIGTSTIFISTKSYVGIGSTTPFSALSVGNGAASSSITVAEYKYGISGNAATSTAANIDCNASTQIAYPTGSAATVLTLINMTPGKTCRVVTQNPNGTAGAITWAITGGILKWTGGTAPTMTTTANTYDICSFISTQGSSTMETIGACTLNN